MTTWPMVDCLKTYQILVVDGVVLDGTTLRLDLRLPLVLIWGIQRFTICHSIKQSTGPILGVSVFHKYAEEH